MNHYPKSLRKRLNTIISKTANEKERFVRLPGKDFSRKSKLPFDTLLKLILSMGSGSLNKELLDYFSIGSRNVSASAFVQQRQKVKPEAFEHIFHEFTRSLPFPQHMDGYRLLAVDGCKLCSVQNPEEQENYYKTFPTKKGFNVHNINALYDLCNRTYVDAILYQGKKDSCCQAFIQMVDRSEIKEKTIVMADRAYISYNNFEHLTRKGWGYVIRAMDLTAKCSVISGTSYPPTGAADQWFHLKVKRKWKKASGIDRNHERYLPSNQKFDFLPPRSKEEYPMDFRAVRLEISKDVYELVITNLNEEEFPPEKLKELYHMRWGIETSFRELKYVIGLLSLHSKKDASIQQEIYAGMTMYNFCEAITIQAMLMEQVENVRKEKQKTHKYRYRVNITTAIHICLGYFRGKCHGTDEEIIKEILKHAEPIRDGKQFKRKKQQRSVINFLYRMV